MEKNEDVVETSSTGLHFSRGWGKMKILTLHCDYIKFQALKKALNDAEELENKEEVVVEGDPLVVLTSVESGDSDKEIKELVESVVKRATELKAKEIVLYPYAHLSSNLAKPNIAVDVLVKAEEELAKIEGVNVTRAPFGYYKSFEFRCKGHPMSELSRSFGESKNEGKIVKSEVVRGVSDDSKEEDISKLLKQMSQSRLDTSKLKDYDHRILGQKLGLFSFNEASPGAAFWHDNGLTVYNGLVDFIRKLQKEAGYQEISTPQILDNKLWKVSGHWQHYKDNMFITDYEGRNFGVKPMNCPCAMLVYRAESKSYRDLPLRLAEMGNVHRQELSGVLSGLFRVARFTQDDAHIFLSDDQVGEEISKILDLINIIYKETFGFEPEIELSTRPEKFMGEEKDWDNAEKSLEDALKKSKVKYKINEGDGAFYGPKIDLHIKDSLDRSWQCGTIQLDMQMPQRFEIEYVDKDGKKKTPLVIHRALFGSFERFIGILLEHFKGALPVWLSPTQVKVLSFTERNDKAVEKLVEGLKEKIPGLRVEADLRDTTVGDKVRDAEMLKIPYMIVIGDKEEEANSLAVRKRGVKKVEYGVSVGDFVREVRDKIESKGLD